MMNKSIFIIHVYQEFNRFCIDHSCFACFVIFVWSDLMFLHFIILNISICCIHCIWWYKNWPGFFYIIVNRNQVSWEIKEKICIDINITQYMNLESSDCWFDHKTKQLITWSIRILMLYFHSCVHGLIFKILSSHQIIILY